MIGNQIRHLLIWRRQWPLVFCRVLQNIWSIRLHLRFVNLVGKVILGEKLVMHITSKNSPNLSRSEIFNKFILKSLTISVYLFSLWRIFIIGRPWDDLLYVNIIIIIIIIRRSICVTGCKCTPKVASVDVNKQAFPDNWAGIQISYCMNITLI